jgi:hypothetical protein
MKWTKAFRKNAGKEMTVVRRCASARDAAVFLINVY